jgi:hypothetical protein
LIGSVTARSNTAGVARAARVGFPVYMLELVAHGADAGPHCNRLKVEPVVGRDGDRAFACRRGYA